jgi:uncharacterized membrane protein YdjX (TVP38/TMEM64 family)
VSKKQYSQKLINEIEDEPSQFVRLINQFTVVCSLVSYAIIAYLLIFHFDLIKLLFTDYSKLQDFISYQYKGPIYLTALFFNIILSVNPFAQLVPIPQLIAFFYGFSRGFIFCMITATASYVLTLYLSRTLGRKVVKKIIGEKNWEKVRILADEEGVFPFFIAHLFPIFPDAIVAWVAGTTDLPFIKLTVVSTIARIPGILLTVLVASGVITENYYLTAGLFIGLILISSLLTKYRKQILKLIDKNH